jgi:hypothetical protein
MTILANDPEKQPSGNEPFSDKIAPACTGMTVAVVIWMAAHWKVPYSNGI